MAGVLFLATVLTYLDRQTLAVCKKQICDEFGLHERAVWRAPGIVSLDLRLDAVPGRA